MSSPITDEEVVKSINQLKWSKAAGRNGIPPSFYKSALSSLVPYLKDLFNAIFDNGEFPSIWNIGMIVPLFKSGNVSDPSNYRGISLLNISGKLFATILERRLRAWVDINELLDEGQAGFRPEYSTTDNLFTLQSLCTKYLSRSGGRFYCAFIDFKKAFDSVDRKKLLFLLHTKGCHGKMYNILRSMYESVSSCVRSSSGITETFDTSTGVRQGCVLSPLLFNFFINELVISSYESSNNGVFITQSIDKCRLSSKIW